jgi:hypothetical protein
MSGRIILGMSILTPVAELRLHGICMTFNSAV